MALTTMHRFVYHMVIMIQPMYEKSRGMEYLFKGFRIGVGLHVGTIHVISLALVVCHPVDHQH